MLPVAIPIDLTVVGVSFVLYTLFIAGIGIYASRYAADSNEDYYLGGRTLGPWMAALSASASAESGWVTAGLVGMAFNSGYRAYWILPGVLIGFMFDWFLMAGRMNDRARETGAVTLPDYFALHYAERRPILRGLSIVVIVASMMAYVAGQLAAAGKAFEQCFGMDYFWGVLVGVGIILAYTVMGGFRAVCWTDFAQAIVMVGALFVFPIYMLVEYGGFAFVSEALQSAAVLDGGGKSVGQPGSLLLWLPEKTGLALLGFLLGSSAMGINLGYPGQPHIVVRFMAMRDRREAKIAGVISGVWTAMVMWGVITVGIMVRALYENGTGWAQTLASSGQNEAALVAAATHLLPAAVAGLVLAAVLSAICSTADSQLVVAASGVANDWFAWRRGGTASSRVLTRVNRMTVALLAIGAVLLVIDQKVEVYKYVLTYAWAMMGAAFGPQLILMLLWRRASYAGCVAGMAVGFAVAVGWSHVYDALTLDANGVRTHGVEMYNLTVAFAVAMAVNVIVSLARPDGERATAVD
jgi:sodium/proline symporter